MDGTQLGRGMLFGLRCDLKAVSRRKVKNIHLVDLLDNCRALVIYFSLVFFEWSLGYPTPRSLVPADF